MNTQKFMLALGMLLSVGLVVAENEEGKKDTLKSIVEEVQNRRKNTTKAQKEMLDEISQWKEIYPVVMAMIVAEIGGVNHDPEVRKKAHEILAATEGNQAYKNLSHSINDIADFFLKEAIPAELALRGLGKQLDTAEQSKLYRELLRSRNPYLTKREADKKMISQARELANNWLDVAEFSADVRHDCVDQYGEVFCDEVDKVLAFIYVNKAFYALQKKIDSRIDELNESTKK